MQVSRRAFTFSAISTPLILRMSAHAQNATPASSAFDPAAARMESLLQYTPGGMLDGELYLVWNDFERQVAAIRENNADAAEQSTDDEISMMSLYANGPQFVMWAAILEDLAGFTFGQVLQSLEFGTPPHTSLLIQLNENPESLIPFWESVDYEQRENDFGTFWTIGENGEIDLQHPVQRALIARFNNIAILPDNVLAYATTSELLGHIMSTAAGDTPNRIAELDSLSINVPEDASDAWFMDGDIFLFQTAIGATQISEESILKLEELIAESNDAVGAMPMFRTACVGLTAGAHIEESLHNPDAREFIILETDGADQAAQAAEVIAWRIENWASLVSGEAYADLLPTIQIEPLDGEHLRVSLSLERGRPMIPHMIMNRDILPFAF